MQKTFFLFLLSLPMALSLFGKLTEFTTFYDLNQHLTEDTLLLLDIDDTLLIPAQMMGSDEWFQHRLKKYKKNGMSNQEALEKALAEWEGVRHLTKMVLVEPGSEKVIYSLQENHSILMGLTTQGLSLATRTSLQLKELNIDLSITSPSKEDCYLNVDHHGVLYRNGILFTSGTDKGIALFQFLEKIGFSPKRILFVNDKASHLLEVEKEALQRGVEFLGLRYSYSDKMKANFNPEIADRQFYPLEYLLSDEEVFFLYE